MEQTSHNTQAVIAVPAVATPVVAVPSPNIQSVHQEVRKYYPSLLSSVDACLAVFGAMALAKRTKPLSLVFETASGFGKTAVLQMVFPTEETKDSSIVYRSDKFTPKAFVTHAANVKAEDLAKMDLLPKLKNKVLVTKELAPIFRGREEEVKENFSTLISVLDGKGFTSDTGMRGQRGYQEPIIFNWIGATTVLPAATHRLMSQLGTRLLFYEVPAVQPTIEQLVRFAESDNSAAGEEACQRAVNEFLQAFFQKHPVGSVDPNKVYFDTDLRLELVHWARFLVAARAELQMEKGKSDWEPVAAKPAEGPFRVVDYFKELARGHALIHGAREVTETDLAFVAEVAISSTPAHLRPLIRELRKQDYLETESCSKLCRVSAPTARRYMKELELLEICELTKGSPYLNGSDRIVPTSAYSWLLKP